MKSFFKWLGISVLTLFLLTVALGLHAWYAKKPLFFRAFLVRTLIKVALDSPETLTYIGVLEHIGFKGHNAEINNSSLEKGDEMYAMIDEVRSTMLEYKDEDLDKNQRLSKEIAMYLIDAGVESKPYRYHDYPVNQLFGVQNGYSSFMDDQHRITEAQDAEHYISRLSAVNVKFAQIMEGLKFREEKGIIPPKFLIDRVLEEMRGS